MTRELKDIILREVSLVDKPANKKKFLFFKQEGKPAKSSPKKLKKKLNITIESDGTIGGTKIIVNKNELADLRSFDFSFYGNEDLTRAINCSYSKFVEDDDGFSRSETFYLSKGDSLMDEKIKKQLEEYFGEDTEVDFEKAEESGAIVKALETVNAYRGDFPDDLQKAVGIVVKQAGICDTIISKVMENQDKDAKDNDDKKKMEKAGAKLSKDTLKKITDALAALKSIIPELKENTEKSDLEKAIEEMKNKIDGMEKKDEDNTKEKLTKTLEELTKRLETVEKGTTGKKGIEGQDDDDNTNKDEKIWPSISSK